MTQDTYADRELNLVWVSFGEHLKVMVGKTLLYSTVTGFVSPLLSERQVTWIHDHYTKKKKSFVFVN